MSKPELYELLRAELAAALGEPDPAAFPDDRPFTDLGFDSLAVIQVRTRLNLLTGLGLPARVLFESPTASHRAGRAGPGSRTSTAGGPGTGTGWTRDGVLRDRVACGRWALWVQGRPP
ncbi:acyl carrier protein [Streptomyces sp. NPDC058470]|uniref:acyl carrier protein n=1 Tax=Streptomyces sp. NPDC058470 TaxID=3346515 RepID=UPI003662B1C5